MKYNNVECKVVEVKTDTGICPGIAKTETGEEYIIGGRTPEKKGICSQAFGAMNSMKLVLSLTNQLDSEEKDYYDIVCPHGFVTYRLSRVK
jgi:hypothetical protein